MPVPKTYAKLVKCILTSVSDDWNLKERNSNSDVHVGLTSWILNYTSKPMVLTRDCTIAIPRENCRTLDNL